MEKPILFSTPMVNAILSGQKKQTRRVIKYSKKISNPVIGFSIFTEDDKFEVRGIHENGVYGSSFFKKPFTTGDLLWVREEHYRFGYWVKNGFTAKGNQKWKFVATTKEVKYSDSIPSDARISRNKQNPENPSWYKRLARFMPKSACRIWLEITNVRVEKLNYISADDCINEGVELLRFGYKDYYPQEISYNLGLKRHNGMPNGYQCGTANMSFRSLWISINGIDSWNANPWVWVIEFKILER